MGPYKRLCRMLDLPVPGAATLAHEEAMTGELARLAWDEARVADLIARFRADRTVMARLQATAPVDEAAALREAARALLGLEAAERVVERAAALEGEEADG